VNDLERRLLASPSLPTLPSVAQRILELFQGDAELTELANLLQAEPAISGRVMQLVNSGLYRLSRQVLTLREAVLYLGFNTVRSVALSFSLLSAFQRKGRGEKLLELLWRISLMRALAARQLAAKIGRWEPEEAFLSGLMSETGALLLYQALPEYRTLLERFERGEGELIELESHGFETDHGRMAVLLLESWNFAPRLLDPIRSSFGLLEPGSESEEVRRRGRILRGGELAARCLLVEGFQSQLPWLPRRLSHVCGLADDLTAEIAEGLPAQFQKTAQLFEIAHERQLDYEELLQRANQALTRQAVAAEQGAVELATRVAETGGREAAADRDEVTGSLSREAFDRLLEAFHRQARRTRRPIGLLVIAIENWKALQESGAAHAHEVLAGLASRVARMIRSTDPNARVAEHQLAVLTPGCAAKDLSIVAERIRLGLDGEPVGGRTLDLAFGLAAAHPHHDQSDPGGFLRAALGAVERAARSPERMSMASA
jgi:diguanylate cyclase (GGDEF)-like protein